VAFRLHARAALITLAILVGLIDGCPIPRPKNVPESMQPAVKEWARKRRLVMTPFKPLGELLRLRQTWKLFPTAKREQHLMWVEGRKTGDPTWELLYRPNDPDHDLFSDRIEYRRLRGAWNPGSRGTRTGYGPFVEWLASQVFALRPDLDRLRVRMEKIELDPAAGGFDASGEFELEKVQRRRKKPRQRRVQ
jgi:hypothetical protein